PRAIIRHISFFLKYPNKNLRRGKTCAIILYMKRSLYASITLTLLILITLAVTWQVFDSRFAEVTIDWFAFLAGIFLIVDGVNKILHSPFQSFQDQFLRSFRVVIGTCVFTIHLLQFMQY
ncbi:MAG: hypothetical protein ABIA77_02590, partial [Candidatus Omnitrophota bacterium]